MAEFSKTHAKFIQKLFYVQWKSLEEIWHIIHSINVKLKADKKELMLSHNEDSEGNRRVYSHKAIRGMLRHEVSYDPLTEEDFRQRNGRKGPEFEYCLQGIPRFETKDLVSMEIGDKLSDLPQYGEEPYEEEEYDYEPDFDPDYDSNPEPAKPYKIAARLAPEALDQRAETIHALKSKFLTPAQKLDYLGNIYKEELV